MYELEHIGKDVLIRHKQLGEYFVACIIDVKDTGYIVKVEERGRLLVGFSDMLVDFGHASSHLWELKEKMFCVTR